MNRPARLYWSAKGVGWDNLPRRVLQACRVRSGLLRRRLDPSRFDDGAFRSQCRADRADQADLWGRRAKQFFQVPSTKELSGVADDELWDQRVLTGAQNALAGEYLFFSNWYGAIGWPPQFNLDPTHDIKWPVGEHWLGTAGSDPPRHDIKLVWEPSRFSLAYYFARAYARGGDEKWAQSFWRMFEAWIEQNPPQLTVAWACGQEMTFRLMAMLFGAMVTLPSKAATAERLYALSRLAWQTGIHISININQARMQGNNHAISEAAGLWTVGLLFGEFPQAQQWRDRGRKVLAAEVKRQIYDDGSYVQHSLNYHRVMMDDLLWAIRLAELNDQPLPPIIADRFERATNWLSEMTDPPTGRVPNYGANDGALVLPLSTCDYTDFRPAAQAAHYLIRRKRCFEPGPWDEKMLWLFGPEAMEAPVERINRSRSFAAPDAGYYILRGPDSWAMTRCHTYRDRPAQADMLHVDLWCKGVNILRDAGSYMYYSQEPWLHYFASTAAHNTVEIDGQDQMIKGPRFLWFKWTKAKVRRFETSPDGRVGYFEGEHYGYRRLPGRVVHRRTICRIDDAYIIVDDILGSGRHDVALRWRLYRADWRQEADIWRAEISGKDVAVNLTPANEMTVEMVTGRESPGPDGWLSQYYGQKEPAPTLVMHGHVDLPACMVSIMAPADMGLSAKIVVERAPQTLLLRGPSNGKLASAVRNLSGGRIRFE